MCLAEVAGGFGTAMERAVVVGMLRREADAQAGARGAESAAAAGLARPAAELALMPEAAPLARAMLRYSPSERPRAAEVRVEALGMAARAARP